MRILFHLRNIPAPLILRRLFKSNPKVPTQELSGGVPRQRRDRYVISLHSGGQVLPFIVNTGANDRRRDPYE
jgi:hypothetical protein